MPTAGGLHYFLHEGGSAFKPSLVLLHGMAGDHLSWPAEVRRLADHRVFTPDLPGHGRTEGPGYQSIEDYASRIVNFLKTIRLSRAVLVGYSMGGAIALALALNYPERVAGICLISTGPRLPIPSAILENAAHTSTLPFAISKLQEASFGPQTPASLKNEFFKRLTAVRRTLLVSDLLACDHFDVTRRLNTIQTPTLVICGADDRLTPLHFSRTLAANIPNAALQTVDGAGHLLVLEQPNRLAKLIRVFLATIPYIPGM